MGENQGCVPIVLDKKCYLFKVLRVAVMFKDKVSFFSVNFILEE